jgi:hypothetical protein
MTQGPEVGASGLGVDRQSIGANRLPQRGCFEPTEWTVVMARIQMTARRHKVRKAQKASIRPLRKE